MLHSIVVIKIICVVMLLMTSFTLVKCKAISETVHFHKKYSNLQVYGNNSRQFLILMGFGRETSTGNFIRLVLMRFIYGLASTMGIEERLEGIFNGAFIPPNAGTDFFGFIDSGDGISDIDEGAFEGLLSDDVL